MSIEKLKIFLEQNDTEQECQLLSTEYIDNRTPLLFKCNICGKEFARTPRQLKRGKYFCCSNCSKKKLSLTIEDVKSFIEENDINKECTLLSTEYVNNKTPLKFKCNICGKEFARDFAHVQRGRFKCEACGELSGAKKLKYTKEEVSLKIKEYGYELMGEYLGGHRPVKCKCDRDHEFDLYFSEFLHRGRGCPQCAIIEHSGSNHPNWQGGISFLTDFLRKKIKNWKDEVLKNKNYTCEISGQIGGDLVVHHLINFSFLVKKARENCGVPIRKTLSDYTDEELLRIESELLKLHPVELGVVLSGKIHKEFHSKYGFYNNTPMQFFEFKNFYYLK